MKEPKDIRDDQIRIIGKNGGTEYPVRNIVIAAIAAAAIITGVILYSLWYDGSPDKATVQPSEPLQKLSSISGSCQAFTEIRDTSINGIPLRLYIPHGAEMSLHIGGLDRNDPDIIYAAQAADIRADNGGIVGAFVLNGEPRAWGLSKKGYCASINGKVTVGVADNSPLFEKATEEGGHFFRQYPLVSDGIAIDNEPKGRSVRRAICERSGEIFMAETGTVETFNDFARALADMGTDQAVYLVGSTAYGWAVDKDGTRHEFGKDDYYSGVRTMPENISYIVWRKAEL